MPYIISMKRALLMLLLSAFPIFGTMACAGDADGADGAGDIDTDEPETQAQVNAAPIVTSQPGQKLHAKCIVYSEFNAADETRDSETSDSLNGSVTYYWGEAQLRRGNQIWVRFHWRGGEIRTGNHNNAHIERYFPTGAIDRGETQDDIESLPVTKNGFKSDMPWIRANVKWSSPRAPSRHGMTYKVQLVFDVSPIGADKKCTVMLRN